MTKKMNIDFTRYPMVGKGYKRGRTSGDEIATALRGLTPDQAECLTALTGRVRSWPLLNPGQRVMNARNVLRWWSAGNPERLQQIKDAADAQRS